MFKNNEIKENEIIPKSIFNWVIHTCYKCDQKYYYKKIKRLIKIISKYNKRVKKIYFKKLLLYYYQNKLIQMKNQKKITNNSISNSFSYFNDSSDFIDSDFNKNKNKFVDYDTKISNESKDNYEINKLYRNRNVYDLYIYDIIDITNLNELHELNKLNKLNKQDMVFIDNSIDFNEQDCYNQNKFTVYNNLINYINPEINKKRVLSINFCNEVDIMGYDKNKYKNDMIDVNYSIDIINESNEKKLVKSDTMSISYPINQNLIYTPYSLNNIINTQCNDNNDDLIYLDNSIDYVSSYISEKSKNIDNIDNLSSTIIYNTFDLIYKEKEEIEIEFTVINDFNECLSSPINNDFVCLDSSIDINYDTLKNDLICFNAININQDTPNNYVCFNAIDINQDTTNNYVCFNTIDLNQNAINNDFVCLDNSIEINQDNPENNTLLINDSINMIKSVTSDNIYNDSLNILYSNDKDELICINNSIELNYSLGDNNLKCINSSINLCNSYQDNKIIYTDNAINIIDSIILDESNKLEDNLTLIDNSCNMIESSEEKCIINDKSINIINSNKSSICSSPKNINLIYIKDSIDLIITLNKNDNDIIINDKINIINSNNEDKLIYTSDLLNITMNNNIENNEIINLNDSIDVINSILSEKTYNDNEWIIINDSINLMNNTDEKLICNSELLDIILDDELNSITSISNDNKEELCLIDDSVNIINSTEFYISNQRIDDLAYNNDSINIIDSEIYENLGKSSIEKDDMIYLNQSIDIINSDVLEKTYSLEDNIIYYKSDVINIIESMNLNESDNNKIDFTLFDDSINIINSTDYININDLTNSNDSIQSESNELNRNVIYYDMINIFNSNIDLVNINDSINIINSSLTDINFKYVCDSINIINPLNYEGNLENNLTYIDNSTDILNIYVEDNKNLIYTFLPEFSYVYEMIVDKPKEYIIFNDLEYNYSESNTIYDNKSVKSDNLLNKKRLSYMFLYDINLIKSENKYIIDNEKEKEKSYIEYNNIKSENIVTHNKKCEREIKIENKEKYIKEHSNSKHKKHSVNSYLLNSSLNSSGIYNRYLELLTDYISSKNYMDLFSKIKDILLCLSDDCHGCLLLISNKNNKLYTYNSNNLYYISIKGILNLTIQSKHSQYLKNITEEKEYSKEDIKPYIIINGSINEINKKYICYIPVLYGDKVIGLLYIYNSHKQSEDYNKLLHLLGNSVEIAIDKIKKNEKIDMKVEKSEKHKKSNCPYEEYVKYSDLHRILLSSDHI